MPALLGMTLKPNPQPDHQRQLWYADLTLRGFLSVLYYRLLLLPLNAYGPQTVRGYRSSNRLGTRRFLMYFDDLEWHPMPPHLVNYWNVHVIR